ncbi:hypothetical protein [Mesorhizobium huakuii]|uniref:hypothetical protein n=1 Tax=Mesorhizobium huakuii TaxID=28104 RepID=UPI003908B867
MAEYKRVHAEVSPEVLAVIRLANIRNYTGPDAFRHSCSSSAAGTSLNACLRQSCSRRARRGQQQARFAARYAGNQSDAPQHGIEIGQ